MQGLRDGFEPSLLSLRSFRYALADRCSTTNFIWVGAGSGLVFKEEYFCNLRPTALL